MMSKAIMGDYVGLIARFDSTTHIGYKGNLSGTAMIANSLTELTDMSSSETNSNEFMQIVPNQVYQLKLVVIGTQISFYVNGSLGIQEDLMSANNPGSVGLISSVQCKILSFKVVAA